jgi:hypothetical protein
MILSRSGIYNAPREREREGETEKSESPPMSRAIYTMVQNFWKPRKEPSPSTMPSVVASGVIFDMILANDVTTADAMAPQELLRGGVGVVGPSDHYYPYLAAPEEIGIAITTDEEEEGGRGKDEEEEEDVRTYARNIRTAYLALTFGQNESQEAGAASTTVVVPAQGFTTMPRNTQEMALHAVGAAARDRRRRYNSGGKPLPTQPPPPPPPPSSSSSSPPPASGQVANGSVAGWAHDDEPVPLSSRRSAYRPSPLRQVWNMSD